MTASAYDNHQKEQVFDDAQAKYGGKGENSPCRIYNTLG